MAPATPLREMGDKKDDFKVKQFKNYLLSGGEADLWYKALTVAERAGWNQTEAAFEMKWPETLVMQKAQTDYELELGETKLEEKELGRKETVLGREVWTHVIWADKMQKLAVGAKVSTGTTYIVHARRGLPNIIKEKIPSTFKNWAEFLTAVREVDIEHIRDGAEKWKREQEKQKAVEDRIAQLTVEVQRQRQTPASPTAGIRQQMTNTRGNLFGGAGTTRGPSTETQKAALRERIKTIVQHPNTPQGCLVLESGFGSDCQIGLHQKQQQAWVSKYGMGALVTELTPYPLRPGTLPINSGECWKCGVERHHMSDYVAVRPRILHSNEVAWRRICKGILWEPMVYGQGGQGRGTANIRLVQIDDYGTWEEIPGMGCADDDNGQGNGQGPSE
ncbi:hypothetical protein B0H17DRAFT_1334320 [Mycena rosella]|uniref:Uncharacterized protein n=1 Tax=Mycena rosella TaxID=1033263 RepID=A0AAD7D445_MYCRO|nr:hypothetical protein B0H17DRAFT_1334320 [Mycena rosella]